MHRHHLVLPRLWLDAALAAQATPAPADGDGVLSWGHAVPDVGTRQTLWRVAALRTERFSTTSTGARDQRRAMAGLRRSAVIVLQLAPSTEPAPATSAQWQHWVQQRAPDYRLLCPGRDPPLLALWIGATGALCAALLQEAAWHPVSELWLPGPGMQRLSFGVAGSAPAAAQEDLHPTAGRYSRLAGALGEGTLQGLQRSVFAVVGLGRTGSVLAHTLVRSGASVLMLDPDHVELHNLCGDVLPAHEGLPKPDAVARWLRPVLRPGAFIDARSLDIGDPVCGLLLAGCDALVSCVDDDRARWHAAAWSSALWCTHLDIGVAVRRIAPGAAGITVGADIRLTLPGSGCLACVGGFAQPERLPVDAAADARRASTDFRNQRAGSLRSWAQLATHAGVRLLELLYAGQVRHSLFRRMREDADGALHVQDLPAPAEAHCPLCGTLGGGGQRAVHADALYAAARQQRLRA